MSNRPLTALQQRFLQYVYAAADHGGIRPVSLLGACNPLIPPNVALFQLWQLYSWGVVVSREGRLYPA